MKSETCLIVLHPPERPSKLKQRQKTPLSLCFFHISPFCPRICFFFWLYCCALCYYNCPPHQMSCVVFPAALCLKKKMTCGSNPPWKTMLSLLLPAMLAVQTMGGCRPCPCPTIRSESPQQEMPLSVKQSTLQGPLVFPLQRLHWAKQQFK